MSQHSVSYDSEGNSSNAVTPVKMETAAFELPTTRKRIVIMVAVYLSVFLVTLDQNIISTAIPRITDEFHSLDDVGWYGTAYLLTMCSFQLLMGKVYKFYPTKPVFIAACLIFEIGSAVCGAAPNSNAFIVGRAIAGLGSSGLFQGCMTIMFYTVPLQQRPLYQGAFGAVFAIASVVGPLLGGTFTDKVTWRWCFYINLPVGAVSIIVTLLILNLKNQKLDSRGKGFMAKMKQLDPIGNLAFLPGIVCLILALQWGGTKYTWKDARIIVLFVLFGILFLVFIGIQIWKQEDATVPPRIFKQRSIFAAVWFGFFQGAALMVSVYYMPIWFQAIKNASAISSGIMLLPLVIASVVGVISSGIVVSRVGYYLPFFILASIFTSIGSGLLSSLTPNAGSGKWIGYQIILGLGLGFGSQQPVNVAQSVLERSDVSTGTALVMFTRFLGSTIFLPVGQNIFLNGLVSKLDNLPGISPDAIINGGATELRSLVPASDLPMLLQDYNSALNEVFYLCAAASAVSIFGAVLVEWRSLRVEAEKKHIGAKESDEAVQVTDADKV